MILLTKVRNLFRFHQFFHWCRISVPVSSQVPSSHLVVIFPCLSWPWLFSRKRCCFSHIYLYKYGFVNILLFGSNMIAFYFFAQVVLVLAIGRFFRWAPVPFEYAPSFFFFFYLKHFLHSLTRCSRFFYLP